MKKWNRIDQAFTPEGKCLALLEHDGEYRIRIDAEDLMSTRGHSSEERLAELACGHLQSQRHPRVLIGGLGMGFTLKAALRVLKAGASVLVAEIFDAVIGWNRNSAFPLAGAAMIDQRVTIECRDVLQIIEASPAAFDSIILDVDNGPAALTMEDNARLYKERGLRLTFAALKPGGCAGFWSAAPSVVFEKALAHAGFEVEVHRCRAHEGSGRSHTLFLARKPLSSPRLRSSLPSRPSAR